MSRIVVLGSTGMLGHKMLERLRLHYMDVEGLSREDGLWVGNREATDSLFRTMKPEIVINCVGHVKQRTQDVVSNIQVNALFPHYLKDWCEDWGARLIHFSTDCVFSGLKGSYIESDNPDPEDVYGRTKALGEINDGSVLTIRTSIIGREKKNHRGLLEWFLKQKGEVLGYTNAIFSGVTTNWLSDMVATLLFEQEHLKGLYHVSTIPVSKYDLLEHLKRIHLKHDVEIKPVVSPLCDRSLVSERFQRETGIVPKEIVDMLKDQYIQDHGSGYAV